MKIIKSSREYKLATGALFLGSIAAFGAEYCVQPIIPILGASFDLEPATASLAVSFGTSGMAFAMIFIALLAKKLPRKIFMGVALIIPAILTILIAQNENFIPILILRLIQGLLLAGYPAMAIAYINEEFDAKIIGAVTGIYIAGTSIGGLLGRIVLSSLTDLFDWRTGLEILGGIYFLIGLAFIFTLPHPKHKLNENFSKISSNILKNSRLLQVFSIAALSVGVFVASYNFISYILLAEPYNLSQTQIGFVYVLFLFGSAASAIMGRLSDSFGNGKIIFLSIIIMLFGVGVSIFEPLAAKLAGIALITYGFFGTHTSAAAWAGKLDKNDKARISAAYMFSFYFGSSVIGSLGGKFLSLMGWNGVAGFLTALLLIALTVCFKLLRKE